MAASYLHAFCLILCSIFLYRPLYSQECPLGTPYVETRQVCVSLKCPEISPRPCKDVVSTDPRVVVTLWDGQEVMCDTQTDGGGWLVIQRRVSGQLDFYRDWTEYKHGFGDIGDEFWFGNEKVYRLTSQRHYELRVDFTYNAKQYNAVYSKFRLSGESDNYKLEATGYSGNAGDGFATRHNNMAFTTQDRDNDITTDNCAQLYHGAWWYDKCHISNLNGVWGSTEYGKGLNWHPTTGYHNSATFTEMKIRLVD